MCYIRLRRNVFCAYSRSLARRVHNTKTYMHKYTQNVLCLNARLFTYQKSDGGVRPISPKRAYPAYKRQTSQRRAYMNRIWWTYACRRTRTNPHKHHKILCRTLCINDGRIVEGRGTYSSSPTVWIKQMESMMMMISVMSKFKGERTTPDTTHIRSLHMVNDDGGWWCDDDDDDTTQHGLMVSRCTMMAKALKRAECSVALFTMKMFHSQHIMY